MSSSDDKAKAELNRRLTDIIKGIWRTFSVNQSQAGGAKCYQSCVQPMRAWVTFFVPELKDVKATVLLQWRRTPGGTYRSRCYALEARKKNDADPMGLDRATLYDSYSGLDEVAGHVSASLRHMFKRQKKPLALKDNPGLLRVTVSVQSKHAPEVLTSSKMQFLELHEYLLSPKKNGASSACAKALDPLTSLACSAAY